MSKKINKEMINDISASYNKLMTSCEINNKHYAMKFINELHARLNALYLEIDPDPRAQIRRAGGYDAWQAMSPEQREAV